MHATHPTADQLNTNYPAISAESWTLDPECTFLNHGSFGACPRAVLDRQQSLRSRLEHNPLRFLLDEAPPLIEKSRAAVAGLIGADPADVVFLRNATAGVNVVMRSLRFEPGDELLILDHGYNACQNIVRFVADRWGAKAVSVRVPWPIEDPEQVTQAVCAAVTDKTRLAVIDHITSPTAMVLPIKAIVAELKTRSIETLVDAAHAPGMVPVDVAALGAAYYTANCHKWLCAPKTAAFLHVRKDRQAGLEPDIISHGSNAYGKGAGDFQMRFHWPGTYDPTPVCCVADSVAFLESLLPGGLPALMQRNHAMAVGLRRVVCEAWGIDAPCPDSMLGAMATLPLFRGRPVWDTTAAAQKQHTLFDRVQRGLKIEVPMVVMNHDPVVHTRFSCQAYNHGGQIARLVTAFADVVEPGTLGR